MNFSIKKICIKVAIVASLLLSCCNPILAQEWQWSVAVKGVDNNARAFLWIPSNCKQIRGIVMAQHNMEEISILENPVFRKKMAKLGFAQIWVSPSPNLLKFFDFSKGAGAVTDAYIDSLATISGYDELRYVPIVGLGHSAAASWPYYFGALNPLRTLACLSVSGQWPYVRGIFSPDIWENRTIDFIPSLETMGEYEAAATWSDEGLKERQEHPLMPMSMLAVPGEGHFASSDRKAEFLAFYIKKAIQYRMTENQPKGKMMQLKAIDPTKSGWLADRWRQDNAPTATAAPVGKYKGNEKDAFWYFDKETVRKVENYGKAFRGLKPQLVGFVQEGKMVPQQNSHIQVSMKFIPEKDGVTFHLKSDFYTTVPAVSSRLSNWTGLPVGAKLGHSKHKEILSIERICGPFKKLSDTTFVLQLNKEIDLKANKLALSFAAKHPGDSEYKSVVQQGEIILPAYLNEGTDQTISFEPIFNQKRDIKELQLKATSDAGVPVYFFVQEGPAEVVGNALKFTKIPPKAKYPLKVTVVAWQYGHSFEPKLKSATPVVQSFYLTK